MLLDELHDLKQKYGLSMQALAYRAKDLGIFSATLVDKIWKEFGQRGWRKDEPGERVPAERPARFRRLVQQALAEGIISERRAGQLYKGALEHAEQEAPAHVTLFP
ncbi:MAG: hypothetical protein AAGN64_16575 [Bacteroidota bacterium]